MRLRLTTSPAAVGFPGGSLGRDGGRGGGGGGLGLTDDGVEGLTGEEEPRNEFFLSKDMIKIPNHTKCINEKLF